MQNILLDFFNTRSNIIKEIQAFTIENGNKAVANYFFIVSNFKRDEDNTIEFDSLISLEIAIQEYFSNTTMTDYKSRLQISKNLDETKPMFVHLMLEI